jgi:hypothetical protein
MTTPLLIDCDTGIDDSLALLYAAASPDAELVAVTCVAGNVDARQVAENTRAVLASGSITFTDAQITVVTTGGRRVTSVTSSSDAPAYLYTADGVVVVVVTSDATLAAHAIERTPAVP